MRTGLVNRIILSIKYKIFSLRRKNPSGGYYLFLDDNRIPDQVFKYTGDSTYIKFKWVIVRDYNEFVKTISKKGLPAFASYDHDLGFEHTRFFFDNGGYENPPDPSKANFKEKTGYDCIKWLSNFCIDNNLRMPKYSVHSKNPVGNKNISSYLENHIKHCETK